MNKEHSNKQIDEVERLGDWLRTHRPKLWNKAQRAMNQLMEDLPVQIVSEQANMCSGQLIVYTDQKTIELLLKFRKPSHVERLETETQVYFDNAGICYICEVRRQ